MWFWDLVSLNEGAQRDKNEGAQRDNIAKAVVLHPRRVPAACDHVHLANSAVHGTTCHHRLRRSDWVLIWNTLLACI